MGKQVGVGIIGTGTIAQHHLKSLVGSEHGKPIAVFDVLADRAEATAREFGVPYVARSVDDLLARPEVDAVIVCTPPFAHAEPTIQALRAGKHVLCEKPFALDPSEAQRMVDAAERAGKFLACGSGRQRLHPANRKARQLLDVGELGEVYHVRSSSFRFRGRPGHHLLSQAAWFLDQERAGGGVIMDGSVYTIDLVLWLMGNPKVRAVMAQTRQLTEEPPPEGVKQDVEDHAVIMLQCEGGKSALIESGWVANVNPEDINGLHVLGTKAGLSFNPLRKVTPRQLDLASVENPGAYTEIYTPITERVLPLERSNGPWAAMGTIAVAFVDAIVEGQPPMTPGRDALEVTRVIDAAYRSARQGRVVEVPA